MTDLSRGSTGSPGWDEQLLHASQSYLCQHTCCCSGKRAYESDRWAGQGLQGHLRPSQAREPIRAAKCGQSFLSSPWAGSLPPLQLPKVEPSTELGWLSRQIWTRGTFNRGQNKTAGCPQVSWPRVSPSGVQRQDALGAALQKPAGVHASLGRLPAAQHPFSAALANAVRPHTLLASVAQR